MTSNIGKGSGSFNNSAITMQINVFLCNLILHFSVLATIRNGLLMCKFVVYHFDEFDNPIPMFIFGFMVTFSNILG